MSRSIHVRAQYGGVTIRSIHDGDATADAAMEVHRADPSCKCAAKITVEETVTERFGTFSSDDVLQDVPYQWTAGR